MFPFSQCDRIDRCLLNLSSLDDVLCDCRTEQAQLVSCTASSQEALLLVRTALTPALPVRLFQQTDSCSSGCAMQVADVLVRSLARPAAPPRRPQAAAGQSAVACCPRKGRHCVRLCSAVAVAVDAEESEDWGDWADVLEEAEAVRQAEDAAAPLPRLRNDEKERVFLVGVELKNAPRSAGTLPTEASLDELAQLAETAGLEVVGRAVQRLSAPDRRTFIGSGKVEEVLEEARALRCQTVIFDEELSPSQARNIEKAAGAADATGIRVADRTALILDVFSARAATREGVLQTQLAQVLYQMPRLTRMWTHLERQSGGGLATKGAGELQLEIDKRLLREQAARIREKLEGVRHHRALHRQRRASTAVPVIALAGYTSAGKSSLLNLLSGADVLADAQLFSTLDPTTRRVVMPSGQACLVSDTVGFIQKLPTQLIAAFRATLEEVSEASVLVHVVDVSVPDFSPQVAAVEAVLEQLDVQHIPRLTLWNKVDIAADPARLMREAQLQPHTTVCVSALTGQGVPELWAAVQALTEQQLVGLEVLFPFDRLDLLADVRRHGTVEIEDYTETGVRVLAKVPLFVSRRLSEWRLA